MRDSDDAAAVADCDLVDSGPGKRGRNTGGSPEASGEKVILLKSPSNWPAITGGPATVGVCACVKKDASVPSSSHTPIAVECNRGGLPTAVERCTLRLKGGG